MSNGKIPLLFVEGALAKQTSRSAHKNMYFYNTNYTLYNSPALMESNISDRLWSKLVESLKDALLGNSTERKWTAFI